LKKILLTNDDGYSAAGLRAIYDALSQVADVTVVAPDGQQSAVSLAVTLKTPLRAWPLENGMKGFRVTGTPSDCVKLALSTFLKEKPDFVFSGCNHGSNIGMNANYSGTVAGAAEGALSGFPSVAISLLSFQSDDFEGAKKMALWAFDKLTKESIPAYNLLNINVPAIPSEDLKGIRLSPVSHVVFREKVEKKRDPYGHDYYWLGGQFCKMEDTVDGDYENSEKGYVTVAPLNVDWTARETLKDLKSRGWDEDWSDGEKE
jgi:5'/3'-nucleotidase